jgi:ATP-dependent Clp protease adaptor protein ClpS
MTIKHQVLIYDDWEHSYNYVIVLLVSILNVSEERAFEMAREVDTRGYVTIDAMDAAEAERIRGMVLSAGPDRMLPFSKASLMVAIQTLKEGEAQIYSARSRMIEDRMEFVSDEQMADIQREGKAAHEAYFVPKAQLSPQAPRRWFQVHLSTAIIMMFLAGLLLFLGRDLLVMLERTLTPDYDDRFRGGDQVVALYYIFGVCALVFAIGFGIEAETRRREARKP